MSMPPRLPANVGSLISAEQGGDRTISDELAQAVHPWLVARARRMRPDLDRRGLADDAAQEAYILMVTRPPGHYDPDRGSPESYLTLLLRTAAKKVTAAHDTPGRAARQRASTGGDVEPNIALDGLGAGSTEGLLRKAGRDPDVAEIELDGKLGISDLRRHLAVSPDLWVADAVELIVSGTPSVDRIAVPGLSRFALRRRLRAKRSTLIEAGLIAS